MASKQISGDGLASNLAGMSKNQLYDIMSQMKSLIEQNQHQARQILIQNPLLTRALFQAQIMLGMVQPPQAVPSIQPPAPQQPSHAVPQTNVHVVHSTPAQVGLQDQPNVSQPQIPIRKQQLNQPSMPMSSTPMQGFHSQPVRSQAIEQHRGHMNTQTTHMAHPQSSQVPNMPSLPVHSGSQPPSVHQPPMPPMPGHLQQPMQSSSVTHQHMLQPPLPPQPRPPPPVQYQPPMGPNVSFPNAGIPQMSHSQSQPMFHPSSRPPGGMGPSFPQGQPPLSNQPPHQPLYQGVGSHIGTDFSNQGGNTMEGASPWPPVSRENTMGSQLHGQQLPLGPGQMPLGNQPPRPPPMARDVEQALLQQVMSLTQEQINLLPPEQRQQVLQLQQMLRQ